MFLFFSHPRSEGWPHHGRTFSIYPCPLSFWLTLPRRVLSTSWCCPSRPCVVFPRLRAPGIVPCIISFSRQLPCFLMVWSQYASFFALTVSNSSLFTPALLRTHSFVFCADHETRTCRRWNNKQRNKRARKVYRPSALSTPSGACGSWKMTWNPNDFALSATARPTRSAATTHDRRIQGPDLQNILRFIVRSTHDSDLGLQLAKISLNDNVSKFMNSNYLTILHVNCT